MPTVTRLEPEEAGSARLVVALDGETVGRVSAERAGELGLREGASLSAEEADLVRSEARSLEALDAALRLLATRPRSRRELERRLGAKGFEGRAVAAALERCDEMGYLDDVAFAASHTRDRIRLKPRGKLRILAELREKGVSEEDARAGIERAFQEEEATERDLAERVLEKKWRDPADRDLRKERRRLSGHLERRGFPFHLIRELVDDRIEEVRRRRREGDPGAGPERGREGGHPRG